jgi:hypothetical protein
MHAAKEYSVMHGIVRIVTGISAVVSLRRSIGPIVEIHIRIAAQSGINCTRRGPCFVLDHFFLFPRFLSRQDPSMDSRRISSAAFSQ